MTREKQWYYVWTLCTGEIMEENSASIKSQVTLIIAVVASLDCERGELLSTTISWSRDKCWSNRMFLQWSAVLLGIQKIPSISYCSFMQVKQQTSGHNNIPLLGVMYSFRFFLIFFYFYLFIFFYMIQCTNRVCIRVRQ